MSDTSSQRHFEVEASGDRAVAAQQVSGVVTTGDHSPVDNRTIRLEPGILRAPSEVNMTVALTNLPNAPAAVFVGREATMSQLDDELLQERAPVVIGHVIHGLGGVGKSELARQYAAVNKDRYRLRWWITAESAEQVQAGLSALAERLHPPVVLALTAEQAADWARGWLQAHTGWLLVIDNVENPVHVRDLLGQLHTGHILVTTRRLVRWPVSLQPIRLEVLNRHAATKLIAKVTERDQPEERSTIEAIAEELGYLPLALEQAGAYIREGQISPKDYLSLLSAHPAHIYAASTEGGDTERTVARLWRVHLDAIHKRNLYAVRLLGVLACYAPDDIPRDILGACSDRLMVLDALRLLSSYSLISLEEDSISVHRLIQAVVAAEGRTTSDEEPLSELALTWLASAWEASANQSPSESRSQRRRLSPHVESLIRHHPIRTELQKHVLFFLEAATHERGEGNLRRAHTLISHAAGIYGAALGDEHPETLACRNKLAIMLRDLGRFHEAEADFRTVLESMRQVLGEEHPETLACRNNLAGVLRDLGRLQEAEAEHRAELRVCHRLLGEEHPETLVSRSNLAGILQSLGRFHQAEAEHRAVLESRRRVLGEEHPDTLTTQGNLATALQNLGRFEEAEAELRTAFEIMRQVLGDEHPVTLASRNNLAGMLRDLGRLQEAEAEFRTAWETARQVLGEEHPHTLISRDNLAGVLSKLGRLQEAEAEHRAVLEARGRMLGEEHPETLVSRNNLAGVLSKLGRLQEAEAELRTAWETMRQVLGEEHPRTLISRNNLTGVLRALRSLDEARLLVPGRNR